ncbi:MAG: 2-amino-4-hydroxy-6-hydroxymethyldihydropteridine diphosphokinase [Verrucomicrobiota bacterium]|jgi:putative acetyltransferase
MALLLRSAVPADRHAIEALVFSVLADYGLRGDPEGTDRDLADLDGVYLKSGGTFDVLIDEAGEVVGSVGLSRISATTCELRKMYLAGSARGQGEGRRLLLHALARAKQLGFRRVELETASVLREALALYVAHGFKPFIPAHLSPRCDCAYSLELS